MLLGDKCQCCTGPQPKQCLGFQDAKKLCGAISLGKAPHLLDTWGVVNGGDRMHASELNHIGFIWVLRVWCCCPDLEAHGLSILLEPTLSNPSIHYIVLLRLHYCALQYTMLINLTAVWGKYYSDFPDGALRFRETGVFFLRSHRN